MPSIRASRRRARAAMWQRQEPHSGRTSRWSAPCHSSFADRGVARLLHQAAEFLEVESASFAAIGHVLCLALTLAKLLAPAARVSVTRREFERLGEIGLGSLEIALLQIRPTAPLVGLGILRIEFECTGVISDRAVILAHSEARVATIGKIHRDAAVDGDRPVVIGDRPAEVFAAEVGRAATRMRLKHTRI